jgi:hypothetical protein
MLARPLRGMPPPSSDTLIVTSSPPSATTSLHAASGCCSKQHTAAAQHVGMCCDACTHRHARGHLRPPALPRMQHAHLMGGGSSSASSNLSCTARRLFFTSSKIMWCRWLGTYANVKFGSP